MFDFINLISLPIAPSNMQEPYLILLPIALILLFCKLFALICKKIKIPEVIGFLLAGLFLGLIILIPNQTVFTTYTMEGVDDLAKIGVVLLMFSAGLETDLHKIKSVGIPSLVITTLGVIVPLILGTLASYLILHNSFNESLFYGVILTATSVSVTVATLKEMGKLDSKYGMSIISAAILDDVIGIVLLSLIITIDGGNGDVIYVSDPSWNMVITILVMASFFVLSFIVGILIRKLFKYLDDKYPHHRRIPLFAYVLCFLFAYISERFFQVADITGAYICGLILSSTKSKDYIDHRTDSISNLFFTPIFFCSIAFKMYTGDLQFDNPSFITFGLVWVLMGLFGKVIGAFIGAKITGFKTRESFMIGIGMMARAEVVIVSAQKGVDSKMVSSSIIPFTLILIITSSLLTPLLLKITGKKLNDETPNKPLTIENNQEN